MMMTLNVEMTIVVAASFISVWLNTFSSPDARAKETHPMGMMVLVGLDHRVLVLEVSGELELPQQQQSKLPTACEWLFSSYSAWFQAQPRLMYAVF
jgi:hypothetical protein